LCIDHLHYLIPLDGNSLNTSFVVGSIVRKLKQLAIAENLIIFLIAHTKKIYQDEELSLSSVRDSSLICQESDYVFLVDREKVKKDAQQLKAEAINPVPYEEEFTNVMVTKLAKNRRTGKNIKQRFNCVNGILTPQDYQQ
jgi:hypothetical protein